jgi:hypothetical protein
VNVVAWKRRTPAWSYAAAGYVTLVATLAAFANRDPTNLQVGEWVAAIVLCMPAFVPALPAFSMIVGNVLHVIGVDDGAHRSALQATYGVAFALVATANVLLVRWIASSAMSSRRRSRLTG